MGHTWTNLVYDRPHEIKKWLDGAALEILDEHRVVWTLPHAPSPELTPSYPVDGKLCGDLLIGKISCYFEIARCAQSAGMPERRWIYGVIAVRGGNGDLGDPGTWTAEESGPLGENRG